MSREPLHEHDIRPPDVVRDLDRLYEAEVERLLARRAEFVETSCPACDSWQHRIRFEKYGLPYRVCLGCETMYISPRPTRRVLQECQAENKHYAYWNSTVFPASEAVRRERIFQPRVERVLALRERHATPGRTLLEIGAGFGTFCDEAQRTGAFERIIAVEPTASLAETCRSRGTFEVIETHLENLQFPENADVVVAFEVIEHVFDPALFVERCVDLLAPGGLLVLTCPNVKGFELELLGTVSPAVSLGHLNYFHPGSMRRLLERFGLLVVEASTPGVLDADIVRNRVLEGQFALENPFLRRVLLDDCERLAPPFQSFLSTHGLSSNMWTVATKRTAGA